MILVIFEFIIFSNITKLGTANMVVCVHILNKSLPVYIILTSINLPFATKYAYVARHVVGVGTYFTLQYARNFHNLNISLLHNMNYQ